MEIHYFGHSCFRLKGKEGVVVTDPFGTMAGWKLPPLKADVVTVSHPHEDHNNILAVKPMAEGQKPFIIDQAGEYEVRGITVFGYPTWHDSQQGGERGSNIVFSIFLDGVHVLHLGDLGHKLPESVLEEIGEVNVLLCPVGGAFTIDPQGALDAISAIEPDVVIPMHYRTPSHGSEFASLATLEEFLQKYGKTAAAQEKLVMSAKIGEEEAETQLVVLEQKTA
jgi:L-ascorbate metabolism protein UlaG (beta-lactamase superfamily)